MPSYLERDQLQSVSPYITNTDAILRGFQTKLQYWGIGAGQLKSTYQNYLGLELSREDNQSTLDTFMKGANEQMKKASNTDLSVGDNVSAAMDIFKPLTTDEAFKPVMGDHALTTFYNNQYKIADQYKTREGGKEYSDTNLRYVQQQHSDFKNSSDPNNWKQYYANKREYTPYVDVTSKIQKLTKDFYENEQFDNTSIQTVNEKNPAYLVTEENKSASPAKLKKYISENLSDKDRNQLGIEASVNLHDLKTQYGEEPIALKYYEKHQQEIRDGKTDLENQLIEVNDKISANSNTSLTDAQRALVNQYKNRRTALKNGIDSANNQLATFSDPKTFQEFAKNLEGTAKNMYINDYVTGLADANSRVSYNQKINQNSAYFSGMAAELANSRLQHDINIDNANKAPGGKKTKEEIVDANGNILGDPNEILQVVGNDSEVDKPNVSPEQAFADIKKENDNNLRSNLEPIKQTILSDEAGINDYKVWQDWFNNNSDKLSTLKVTDMPPNLQKAVLDMMGGTEGLINPDYIKSWSAKTLLDNFNKRAEYILNDYIKDGSKTKYGSLDMVPIISNYEKYTQIGERYKTIEAEYKSAMKEYSKKSGMIAVKNEGNWGGMFADNKKPLTETQKLHAAEQILKAKSEYSKKLLSAYPEIQRATVGQQIAIKMDTDAGDVMARSVGYGLIQKILALPKDLSGYKGVLKKLYLTDSDGNVKDGPGLLMFDESNLNPEAREALATIQINATNNPITSMIYHKQSKGGYWDVSVKGGTAEKPKNIHFQIVDNNNKLFQDEIADHILTTGMTYKTLVGDTGAKIEYKALTDSNAGANSLKRFEVKISKLEPIIDDKKQITGFNIITPEPSPVPDNVSLSQSQYELRMMLTKENKMKRAFDAFVAINKRYPTVLELNKELKTNK